MDRPTNRMIITAVLWFGETLDAELLREILLDRLVGQYPSFRRRAVERAPWGGPAWEDDESFDVDLHLHHIALAAPGDRLSLAELVGDIASTPLSHDKPLWDAHLVDGYLGGSALVLRVHHCVADGIALARVLLSITDDAAPPAGHAGAGVHPGPRGLLPDPLVPFARAGLGAADALVRRGAELLAHPGRLPRIAGSALADTRALAAFLLAGRDPQSAIHGELGPVERVAWSDPVPLARVKALARAHDATVNDVLVSVVAGALGRYLGQRDDAPAEIHAMVPFNLRPADRPLPRQLGNRFGLVLLALPIAIADPVQRLAAVRSRMAALKRSREGAVSYGLLAAVGAAPAGVEDRFIDFFSTKASLVLTNIPGPRGAVRLAGSRVRGALVWAPCAGDVSMSVSIFSLDGAISVGFLGDAGLVPDPDALVERLEEELGALADRTPSVRPEEGQ